MTYKGADVSLLQEAFAANYAKLEALSTNDIPTAFATQITSLKSTYTNTPSSKAELNTANEEMEAIIAAHPSIVAAYAPLNELITLCSTYVTENYSSVKEENTRSTFTTAISTATTDKENATTAAKLTEAYNTLEAARQTFILAAYPTDGNSFDMTFKITNPSFETGNATGWKVINSSDTGVKPNSNATYTTSGVDGNYLFNTYWQGTPLTQALSNMPNGIYELKVLVASDGCTVYLTADDEHNDGTDTYSTGKGQFVEATMTFTCTDGNVVIGVVGGADGDASAHKEFTANGYWWYKADNFRLTRTFNKADMQSALTDLLTEANTMANQPMDANIKEALNSTIQATDATATDPATLDDMINALTEAMASAEASINDYAKLKKYIDMTAVFTDVSTYQAKYDNTEYSSEDVETVRRELNVMRFNAASLIFPNNIEVTGWEGTMGGKNTGGQHWDGTTGENATKYYDNNSWNGNAHSTTTNITLPAGNYVLKAALRSNENTTLKLTVLDETVNVEGKGDQGYGITINGAASFSPDSTYANDNNGRGWEWEFVKFELADETTVTLTVECDYNGVYGWASFSDITLWMDDATYVTVYGKELEAPLAEARTLVNTLPMGDAENTALANAIELGEGTIETPAQLNAAVDALKAAVANAKAWRSTYNTEKDKLVAALERFEADYNDAENGALDYMNKSRWETAIAKAQAAAVAKDDLTSYERLTTATAELTAALDAATVSVDEYADLKTAITEATTVTSANVGVNAFQKSQSAATTLNEQKATAQGVYETATADGEGVTSETETLTNAISTFNNTPLNAPKENARYNIVVETTDDWGGHAATFIYDEENKAEDGYFNLQWLTEPSANYAQAFTFTASSELNTYTLSFVDHLGTTRYLATQKGAGYMDGENVSNRTDRLRITDDANKALKVQVIALNTDGLYQLKNTEHGQCIGYTTNHDLFTQTRNVSLKEAEKANVTLTLSSAGWATLILPFNAELPEGVKAWSCAKANDDVLELVEAESIVANTPYLMNGYESTHTFSGYGLADKDSYTEGLFTGTYVDYATTANSNTYVLQNKDGEVAFYLVGEGAQPTVKPYRIYMTYEAATGAPLFRINRVTTTIEGTELDAQDKVLIYDLMGRRVNTMEKGGMYIINGKKVVIR